MKNKHPSLKCSSNTYRGPEFVPLPSRKGDEVFSLSRSFWYSIEKQGFNVLVHLRRPGNIRGRVMLNVRRAFVALERLDHKMPTAATASSAQPQVRSGASSNSGSHCVPAPVEQSGDGQQISRKEPKP
jgi:hypothetical protein